ncbi:uncharacterized protein LOC130774041 [Actinidia eriantha]|uniref:uncharacterized protein LOC130774041 n=1 Tax=Actinidia eriantha TaxID=165200 RepID=UPI00258E6948|nr:uncharacterized protein LOC130774041 [Actinidia eriantha]
MNSSHDSVVSSGPLPPSRRISLFTLATSMAIFSSKAYNVLPLVPCVKAAVSKKMVLETAHQVGRLCVCTAPDVSYKEMAGHCEALLMGKKQKMSYLMSTQQRSENILSKSLETQDQEEKKAFHFHVDMDFQWGGNALTDQNVIADTNKQSVATVLCATEYQHHPHSFRLPVSSPFDNFLNAAGS